MSEAAFYRLTPRQFYAYTKRLGMRDQLMDARFGIVGALIANQWRAEGSEPIQPHDLFPSLPKPIQSDEDFLDDMFGYRLVESD